MSKWNDLINKYNPDEDDLFDLFDEAEKIGRDGAIDEFAKLIHQQLYQLNHHQVDFLAEQLKEHTNE